jgi:hypothetical protein
LLDMLEVLERDEIDERELLRRDEVMGMKSLR